MKTEWNPADIEPVEYKCLVKMNRVESRSGGGILMTDERVERDQFAQVFGELVSAGSLAFSDWEGSRPRPGDRIVIIKYAGEGIERADDFYRIIQDKDIVAIDRRTA